MENFEKFHNIKPRKKEHFLGTSSCLRGKHIPERQ